MLPNHLRLGDYRCILEVSKQLRDLLGAITRLDIFQFLYEI